MLPPFACVIALTCAWPLLGQQPQAPQEQEPQRLAVHQSAGLEALPEGRLRGGGADYDVAFHAGGMRFEPALGRAAATTQHFAMTPIAVSRDGAAIVELPSFATPVQHERTAIYPHSEGIRERYHVGVEGVEVSWQFDQRPAGTGDLLVRYHIDTGMLGPIATGDGGLGFGLQGVGGVTIGSVTGVDAAGNTAAGTLRYVDDELHMSLPASFVDAARYPLVLDPMVGTKFDIWGGPSYNDSAPDCSYENTEDRYLVVFNRTFSISDVRVRGQIVSPTSGLFQGVIWITGSNVVATRPRVASFSRLSRWGVVWIENVGTVTIAYFRYVSSVDGTKGPTITLATSTAGTLKNLDIGSEAGSYQQEPAFVAVWDDTNDNRIYARRIGFQVSGSHVLHPGYTVFADSGFTNYSEPAIARAAPTDGKLMVVAKRYSGIGPTEGVRMALLSASDNTVTNTTTLQSTFGVNVKEPAVDGYGNQWVVSWTQNNIGSSIEKISQRSVTLVGSSLQAGTTQSIGGSALALADKPAVAYSPGKTWLSYRYSSFGNFYLRATGLDSSTCASCADTFSESVASGIYDHIAVATTISGNDIHSDDGMIVWNESTDIWAQLLSNHGGGGSAVHLGGGCGNGGVHIARAPATGRSTVSCSITQLSPTALVTVFNLASAATPIPCGTCEWLPFAFTVPLPVTSFQNASLSYTIPCLPALVGAQFETQWTTLDPAAAPCSFAPSFALSDRYLHTIGQ